MERILTDARKKKRNVRGEKSNVTGEPKPDFSDTNAVLILF